MNVNISWKGYRISLADDILKYQIAISLSASSLTQEQILRLQVRHRTRTWRHGKWCGTCRTVIDWRGLRTVEASCSEWYPGVGTPIQTGGRNSKRWEGIWPSFSRTIWTDITWTSRVSHPNAPIEHSFRFERNPFGNYFLFRRSSRPSRVDLHRYRLVDIWTMFAEATRSILLKSYSFMRCWHLIDNCTSGVMFLFMYEVSFNAIFLHALIGKWKSSQLWKSLHE